jgi:TonB family protein
MKQPCLHSTLFVIAAFAFLLGSATAQNAGGNTANAPAAVTPAKVERIDVQFPAEIRRIGRSVGPMRVVKLDILVQRDGKAGDVTLAMSSGFDPYDNAAVEAARNATYVPATEQGMAVESRLAYDVSFGLLCNRAAGNVTCDNGRFPTTCEATVCALLLR